MGGPRMHKLIGFTINCVGLNGLWLLTDFKLLGAYVLLSVSGFLCADCFVMFAVSKLLALLLLIDASLIEVAYSTPQCAFRVDCLLYSV